MPVPARPARQAVHRRRLKNTFSLTVRQGTSFAVRLAPRTLARPLGEAAASVRGEIPLLDVGWRYGVDTVDLLRRAATYVDRILKGEKASDLAVQAPVKFGLVLNLKTAKALGLDVPAKLLAVADEVIE